MAKIYRVTDRIEVKIDDVTVKIAPLTYHHKMEIKDLMTRGAVQKNYKLIQDGITKALQYSVKSIDGVTDSNGEAYRLGFDEQGHLTEDCVGDLYNMEMHSKLVMVCSAMVKAIPSVFTDENGEPLKGVEIVRNKKETPTDPN